MQLTSLEKKQKKLIKHWKKSLNPKATKPKVKPLKNSKLSSCPVSLRDKSYFEFLKSDYWKKVRAVVIIRDGRKCTVCKSDQNLQVHHKTYKNHFKEHLYLGDLKTLCRECHEKIHVK